MRQMLRLGVLVGVSLAAVCVSAIPSYAADEQNKQTVASEDGQGRLGQQVAERGSRTSAPATADNGSDRTVPPRAGNSDRGRKYVGEMGVNKRWWWWQQAASNGTNDNPGDEGDDAKPNTNSGDPASSDDARNKVTICHIPPGNPENAHTISVNANAVPAHLAHGDTLGTCPGDETPSAP